MKNKNEKIQIRITDRGALSGITIIINTLMLIGSILSSKKINTVEELVLELKNQLSKTLGWLERIPDGTALGDFNKKQLDTIKKDAKTVLSWKIIPDERDYKRREKYLKEWESLEKEDQERLEKRITVMADTSFLLSYLSNNDSNHFSANAIVRYLNAQKRFFDFYLPNLVILELVSKLKQKFSFNKANDEFQKLINEISDSRVLVSDQKIGVFEIFTRYQNFSKKKLSSRLKSNDFIIATDGIIKDSLILTCDTRMYEEVKKTYKNIFLITKSHDSYVKFINMFEKNKKLL